MIKYYDDCLITNVVDGDTIDVAIDLGFSMHTIQRVRLYGINAPEVRGKDKVRGLRAKAYVANNYLGTYVNLEVHKVGKYGRYIAAVFPLDNIFFTIGDMLLSSGLAERVEYS